jgi:hypothetical protein
VSNRATTQTYVVILDIRYGDEADAYGTTRDEIDATSAEEAIDIAISQWKKVRPDRNYHALYTAPVTPTPTTEKEAKA